MLIDPYEIRAFKQERPFPSGLYRVRPCELKLRRHAAKFARSLQFEQGYDFPTFDENLPLDALALYLLEYGGWWIGAFCFVESMADRENSHCDANSVANWKAAWFWLHPNRRRSGVLTELWPQFEALHGRFLLQAPLSKGMKPFAETLGVSNDRIVLR